MREITEELPAGATIIIEGEFGTKVHYVGTDLGIRTAYIRNEWFVPNFMLQDVGSRMVQLLRKELLNQFPNAQEMRIYKRELDWIFLCCIELPHE